MHVRYILKEIKPKLLNRNKLHGSGRSPDPYRGVVGKTAQS